HNSRATASAANVASDRNHCIGTLVLPIDTRLVREGETFRPVAKRRTQTCRTAMQRHMRLSHYACRTEQARDLADVEQNANRAARRAKFPRRDCCRPKTSPDWSNCRRRRGECWSIA